MAGNERLSKFDHTNSHGTDLTCAEISPRPGLWTDLRRAINTLVAPDTWPAARPPATRPLFNSPASGVGWPRSLERRLSFKVKGKWSYMTAAIRQIRKKNPLIPCCQSCWMRQIKATDFRRCQLGVTAFRP